MYQWTMLVGTILRLLCFHRNVGLGLIRIIRCTSIVKGCVRAVWSTLFWTLVRRVVLLMRHFDLGPRMISEEVEKTFLQG